MERFDKLVKENAEKERQIAAQKLSGEEARALTGKRQMVGFEIYEIFYYIFKLTVVVQIFHLISLDFIGKKLFFLCRLDVIKVFIEFHF